MIPLAFSKAYKRGVVDKIPQMMPQTGNVAFRHGLFAGCCWNDCQTCMHVCCCPQARVAHTLKIAGLAEYWIIVLLYMFLNLGRWIILLLCGVRFFILLP